jgi:hypothetical protein
MSEFGAQFARVPIHYLSKTFEPQTNFELHWIQLWDCFSYYFSVHRFDYLKNASAYMLLKDKSKHVAKYAFTIDWCNGEDYNLGYSEISSGHKCAHIFWGEGGQMFAQPNNRIVWHDDAWVYEPIEKNPGYKIDLNVYSVENKRNKFTEYSYFTEFSDAPIHHSEPQLATVQTSAIKNT